MTGRASSATRASDDAHAVDTAEIVALAERFRAVVGSWVRLVRDEAGTPRTAAIETLRLVRDGGAATVATLAARRGVRHQSMRLVIEQLVAERALSRRPDPADRRQRLVSITAKGRQLLERDARRRVRWIARFLEGCDGAEVRRVDEALRTLEVLLQRGLTPPGEEPRAPTSGC